MIRIIPKSQVKQWTNKLLSPLSQKLIQSPFQLIKCLNTNGPLTGRESFMHSDIKFVSSQKLKVLKRNIQASAQWFSFAMSLSQLFQVFHGFNLLYRVECIHRGGGRGYSLIWAKQICVAPNSMVCSHFGHKLGYGFCT